MMKKILLPLVWICGFAGIVSAQTFTNTRLLNQAAIEYKIAYEANYAKALSMAKQKGWELTIKTKSGNAVLVGVDNFGFPKYYITHNNTIAAATTRASQLWPGGASGLNLSGNSANMKNRLGIWDGGSVLGTHVELTGRVTQKDNPGAAIDHATHVTGTLMATGVNPIAKGMAFGLLGLVAYDFNNDIAEMTAESANLVVSNHSYGFLAGWNFNDTQNRWEFYGDVGATEDYRFGYYNSDAQNLDDLAYNAPFYLIVKSAGNNRGETGPAVGQPYYRFNSSNQMVSAGNRPAGISSNDSYDGIVEDIGAKNILSVGAVKGLANGYSRKEDVVMSDFSSWGPTDDGRIKPDVVADGVQVTSCISTTNTAYATFDGTSMASPNAAGSLFLLQEYYSKLKPGSFLRSATLKGLAIHTANEAGPTPGPDYQFGWGLLNVEKAAAVITAAVPSNNASNSAHLLFENTLAQGTTFTQSVVATGKVPLQATICWTDPKGNVVTDASRLNNHTKVLVNDLDIRITRVVNGVTRTYFPWTLDYTNPSGAAVPGDNSTDNVEKIDLDSTVPGATYVISVQAKGTQVKGPQAYSLLVSGVGGTPYCTSASGGGGARIDSVSFSGIHQGNSAGSKTYTDNTKYITDIEPNQTLPIAVKVSTADATANPRIVKVFMDLNNNGTFETNELMATSATLTSAAQIYNGSIVIPGTVTVGSICLMRVIVQETSTASDIVACGTYLKGETQDYRVRVVPPSNDVSISQVALPQSLDCASNTQYISVFLTNNGALSQSNIPLTVAMATGSTAVANLSFTYPGPLPAFSTVLYTFQAPVITAGGTTYAITATASLTNDQLPSNNSLTTTILTSPKPTAITGVGEICGSTVFLKVNSPDASANYLWYSSATGTTPFATGSSITTPVSPGVTTYYVQKDAQVSIGPATNKVFTSGGGYNTFFDNYMRFNNSLPLTIKSARLYIGNPGKLYIAVGNNLVTTTQGTSYNREDFTTIDVYPTTTSPGPGTTGNPATDTGAVYNLNLSVPSTGDHILLVECLNGTGRGDSSSIFRNNNIVGSTTYPLGTTNILTFTGNSATGQEAAFYYFFYDMKVETGCVSDRVAVVATTAPKPVISQQADSLVSSVATGNQWYLNDTAIAGANQNHFKPTKAGKYKVIVSDAFGCVQTSDPVTFAITATIDVAAREINLQVSPNPNNGVFNLSFEVSDRADLMIDILSSSGQKVYTSTYSAFTGKFSKQIEVGDISSEFYILKIQHNKKTYLQKLLIVR